MRRICTDPKEAAQLPIIDRKNPGRKFTKEEEKWLREIRTYEFANLEQSNLSLPITYGNGKHRRDFTFFPGRKYDLPRFIAMHVEASETPDHDYVGEGLNRKAVVTGYKPRFQMREVLGNYTGAAA